MKIARFVTSQGTRYGVVNGNSVVELRSSPFTGEKPEPWGTKHQLADVRLLSPTEPTKIVLMSKNYRATVKKLGLQPSEEILLGMKPVSAMVGPGDAIRLPAEAKEFCHESELAVIIGRPCRDIPQNKIRDYILGYTCFNDVSALDIMERTQKTMHPKAYDSFAPTGPLIETDIDIDNTGIRSFINGELRVTANTSDMIFPIPELVSYISRIMTLMPGDIIATGNSGGRHMIKAGDTVDIEIENIGKLTNPVIPRTYAS
jgi:2-keto-4-pentenoate hydratase/2-oxohepta-3-ene-1,7-dioic acid hydratase in catechol pathway